MKKLSILASMVGLLSVSHVSAVEGDDNARLNYQPLAALKGRAAISDDVYLVEFSDPSVAKSSQFSGLSRLNASMPAVKHYAADLKAGQTSILQQASLNAGEKINTLFQYQYSMNGAAVRMSENAANVLRKQAGVKRVEKRQIHYLHTDSGPRYVGAPAIWDGETGVATKGEGVIVGIMDTGINADHPSFAARGDDGYTHVNPLGDGQYLGDCQTHSEFCNSKLIGIVSYADILNGYPLVPIDEERYGELGSRLEIGFDFNGHGSHVAGTVAGNILKNVPAYNAEGKESNFAFEQISGMAPHANIVSYQVCYPGNSDDYLAGCLPELTLQAVEHAIANGVSVLNYSVGGSATDPWYGFESQAFLNARTFGVHVATSAGNSGPDSGTIGTPANLPWVTTVAAFTHDRTFAEKQISFTGGSFSLSPLVGRSASGGLTAEIVDAADFGDGDCLTEFAAGTFNGEIVVCRRGEIARVAKGSNVKAGGAGGLVLINVDGGSETVDNDFHVLPSIHLDATQGQSLVNWLAEGSNHIAVIEEGEMVSDPDAGSIAGYFSSRGPGLPYDSYLSLDIAAPGVSIYAPFTENQPFSNTKSEAKFAFLDGTSMASPHVAGAYALIEALHPEWTPAEAQSAIVMTADSNAYVDDDNTGQPTPANFYEMGNGMLQVQYAAQAGLVLNETEANYLAADPQAGGNPATLNLAQLVDQACVISCQWTRTFKATRKGTWQVTSAARVGDITLTAEPASFTLNEGETQTLTITASSSYSSDTDVQMGHLILKDGEPSHTLTLPAVVNFIAGVGPEAQQVQTHSAAGSLQVSGYKSGAKLEDLTLLARGLKRVEEYQVQIQAPETQPYNMAWSYVKDNRYVLPLVVNNSTQRVWVNIESTTSKDLDVYIGLDEDLDGDVSAYEGSNQMICISAEVDSNEQCDLLQPEPGVYYIVIHNFEGSAANAMDDVRFTVATLQDESMDNLAAELIAGEEGAFSIKANWQLEDAKPGDRYLGVLAAETKSGQRFADTPIDFVITNPLLSIQADSDVVLRSEQVSYEITINSSSIPSEAVLSFLLTEGTEVLSVDGAELVTTEGKTQLILNGQTDISMQVDVTDMVGSQLDFGVSFEVSEQQTDSYTAESIKVIDPLTLTVNGEQNLIVSAIEEATLVLTASANEGTSLVWSQVSGVNVTLNDDNAGVLTLNLPELDEATTLIFSVTATDEYGQSVSQQVTINVAPESKKSSNGSLSFLTCLAIGLLVVTRRKFVTAK